MSKYTLGPWRIGKIVSSVVADRPVDDRIALCLPDVEFYGGHLICESIFSAANARLIAAAPEMLEALRAAAAFTLNQHVSLDCHRKKGVGCVCGFDAVHAAIAKAEGREG